MKIVHEIYVSAEDKQTEHKGISCSFSGHGYSSSPKDGPPQWVGARVEGVVCWRRVGDGKEEAIHVEGDLEAVRSMCRQILEQLDLTEEHEKKEMLRRAARTRRCEVCGYWYDQRFNDDGHGDGYGYSCQGDGTVYLCHMVKLVDNNVSVSTSSLKKGHQFTIDDELADPAWKDRVFTALEDGCERGVRIERPAGRSARL